MRTVDPNEIWYIDRNHWLESVGRRQALEGVTITKLLRNIFRTNVSELQESSLSIVRKYHGKWICKNKNGTWHLAKKWNQGNTSTPVKFGKMQGGFKCKTTQLGFLNVRRVAAPASNLVLVRMSMEEVYLLFGKLWLLGPFSSKATAPAFACEDFHWQRLDIWFERKGDT